MKRKRANRRERKGLEGERADSGEKGEERVKREGQREELTCNSFHFC